MEKLAEASAAEAEAVSAVWQAMQAASAVPSDETSVSDDNSQAAETTSDGSDTEADVRLHPRAVCSSGLASVCCFLLQSAKLLYLSELLMLQVVVAKEAVGNLGGMVRQLSLDQFENESRRMVPMNNDLSYPTRKFTRQKSPQGLHKKANIIKCIVFFSCLILFMG